MPRIPDPLPARFVSSVLDSRSKSRRTGLDHGASVALMRADRSLGPDAERNHPTESICCRASSPSARARGRGERLHASYTYGALAMDAYRTDDSSSTPGEWREEC